LSPNGNPNANFGDSFFELWYNPDSGDYNPRRIAQYHIVISDEAEPISNLSWRWFSDSGYTNLVSSDRLHYVTSFPSQVTNRWLQYNRSGSWTNYGLVQFTDNRGGL
jgi:hypothetical protein